MGFRRQKLLTGLAFCTLAIVVQPFRLLGQSSEPAPPTIRSVSPDQIVNAGSSAYFSVDAVSYVPPQYQWQFNGEDIAGSTNSWLSLRYVDDTQEGSYRVRVSNPAGEVLSPEIFLTVIIAAADILVQPTNRTALVGQYVTFAVRASGLPPPSFQWFFNHDPISDATSNVFTRARAAADHAGFYSVVISNKYGSRMSDSASLLVNPPEYHAGAVDLTFDAGQHDYGDGDYFAEGPTDLLLDGNLAVAGYFLSSPEYRQTVGIVGPNGKALQDFGMEWMAPGGVELAYLQALHDGRILAATKVTFGSNEFVVFDANGALELQLSRTNLAISPFGIQPNGNMICGFSSDDEWVELIEPDGRVRSQNFNFPTYSHDGAKVGAPHRLFGAVQRDGKFLFWSQGRYLRHGAKDLSFPSGFGGPVLRFYPDGRILGGGSFTNVFGQTRVALVRMLPDGTVDSSFDAHFRAGTDVKDVAIEPSGRIVVVGTLRPSSETDTYQILRLESDGNIDPSFDRWVGSDGFLKSVLAQPDGQIIVGGKFQLFNNYLRPGLVRLYADVAGPPRIVTEPRSQIVEVGRDVLLTADTICYPFGRFQWRFNGEEISGATNRVLEFTNVKESLSGEYELVISNSFGSVTSVVATLAVEPVFNQVGTVDTDFFPGSGADNIIYDLAVQRDSKIIIVGSFTEVEGIRRKNVARLNSDGTLDLSFRGPEFTYDRYDLNPRIDLVELCSDGKMLIAGAFTNINGQSAKGIARLDSDGALESAFPSLVTDYPNYATGPYGVKAVAAQADGRFLVGGFFRSSVTNGYISLARFNIDGSPDFSFFPLALRGPVWSMSLQPDGKIIASTTAGLTRFLESGARDLTFSNLPIDVISMVPRTDGKILVAFANGVALLDNNGRFDSGFSIPIFADESEVHGIALQDCDKILVFGSLKFFNDPGRAYHLLRLTSDGALDPMFPPKRFDGLPRCLGVQRDGQIVLGGEFSRIEGAPRDGIVRLHGGMTNPPPIFAQPESQTVAAGQNVTFQLSVPDCSSVFFQWQLNGTNIPGATNRALVLENVRAGHVGEYRVVVNFGTGRNISDVASLNITPALHHVGSIDIDFYPAKLSGGPVRSLARDGQGNLVIGGNFSNMQNRASQFLMRLKSEGNYDNSFKPNSGLIGPVSTLAIQPNGRIVVGGVVADWPGTARDGLQRLLPDGTLDSSFMRSSGWMNVNSLALQPDGKIIVGGRLITPAIYRLLENGLMHSDYFAWPGDILCVAVQREGKVVLGGVFTEFYGTPHNRVARLLYNAGVDGNFNPPLAPYGSVLTLAVDEDDKIWVGGDFVLSTMVRSRISRLNPDGSLDTNFNAGDGPNGAVYALLPQPNGKILIGGAFTSVNGIPCGHIARLNWDGSLDSTFVAEPGADDTVFALAADVSGKVYIGGAFSHVNGYERDRVARLNNDPLLFQPQFNVISGFQVSLFTFAGQRYVLEFKSSMEEPDWRTVTAVLGDGTIRRLSDSAPEGSQRFYRVRLE